MLKVEVKLSDARMAAVKAASPETLEELHQAMAEGVETRVRGHLMERNKRSPRTGFYGKAARSLYATADAAGGMVVIPRAGMALRLHGGRVTAGKSTSSATGRTTKNLAIPTDHVPVVSGERMRPGEMADLAYIPSRKFGVSVTTGYLVEGERRVAKSGKNKGQERLVPKDGGLMMYVLRGWTDHEPDPTVLPDDAALEGAAAEGGVTYLEATLSEQGLA